MLPKCLGCAVHTDYANSEKVKSVISRSTGQHLASGQKTLTEKTRSDKIYWTGEGRPPRHTDMDKNEVDQKRSA